MSKTIVIDATLLKNDRITGVERYIIELVKSFSKSPTKHTFYILLNKTYKDFDKILGFGTPIYTPTTFRVFNDQIWIPYILAKLKADLIHFPVFGAPLLCPVQTILTIHDATPWKFPETTSKGVRFYYKPLFRQSIQKAKKIITVSNSSRIDLINLLGIPPKKIETIYEAVDKKFFNVNNIKCADNLKLTFPYILSVGTIEPRKNIATLIEAFRILKHQYKVPHKLVFTGRLGWADSIDIEDSIKSDIIFTGFLQDEALPSLYNNASVYVFPSIYEGFGFPILEAFALKVPVVCSNTSSLPEIGSNGCLYANPYSAEDFALKVHSIIVDINLRDQLVARGTKILDQYSWDKCGEQTINQYDIILKNELKKK